MRTAVTVSVQRSGPAIRAALAEHAPEECARFESEIRASLARAADTFDLAHVDKVLTRWHALATMTANPLRAEEQAQLNRARAGDLTGLRARDEQGNWVTV